MHSGSAEPASRCFGLAPEAVVPVDAAPKVELCALALPRPKASMMASVRKANKARVSSEDGPPTAVATARAFPDSAWSTLCVLAHALWQSQVNRSTHASCCSNRSRRVCWPNSGAGPPSPAQGRREAPGATPGPATVSPRRPSCEPILPTPLAAEGAKVCEAAKLAQ